MVGDRFDTDVRAGLSAGFRTCLVLTGCHNLDCQRFYRTDPADFYATSVGALIPSTAEMAGETTTAPAVTLQLSSPDPSMALEHWVLMQVRRLSHTYMNMT